MAYYMMQASYTPEAWKSLVKNPQNRLEAVRAVAEKLGGKVEHAWLTFGDFDVVAICNLPDNVSAAAFAMAAVAGGALKAHKTTPLMTFDDGMAAMKMASGVGYKPPKG